MDFPANPIAFLDQLADRIKTWVRHRARLGESLRYMGENVDQVGRGRDFLTHLVHNPNPAHPIPHSPHTDLALLELYDFWREQHGMRPIEPWDGTKLRPWLPSESNPSVPTLLNGDLSVFNSAMYRGRPWGAKNDESSADGLDALGNAIESYFDEIRRFDVWGKPISGGTIRLYRHNDLNNMEVASYSIRFWGFLKWADGLRREFLGDPVPQYPHDNDSDITFMDDFNQDHFPWHDDVFGNGKCPSWQGQHGLRMHYKYPRGSQGYGLEFLEFHGDLIKAYNVWLQKSGRLPTTTWRTGWHPWQPGIHDTAYILKYAFSGIFEGWHNIWGLGGSNGKALDPELYVRNLLDGELSLFDTAAELGLFLETCNEGFHGVGHVERCDMRDQYLNNYSLRFFHWHTWIDQLYQKVKEQKKPLYNPSIPLDQPVPGLCSRFESPPQNDYPIAGVWTYRSYHNIGDPEVDEKWFEAEMELEEAWNGRLTGQLRSGHPDYVYDLEGRVDSSNVNFTHTPEWWDERLIIILTAKGATAKTQGHVYEYRGHLVANWPRGKNQVRALVGSVLRSRRPDDRSKEGTVGSFICVVKQ